MGKKANRRRELEARKLAELRAQREALERREREFLQRVAVGGALLLFGVLIAVGTYMGPDLPGPEARSASLLVVFGIGLTAGGLSCLAVQGGLLTVAVTGERERSERNGASALEGNAGPILWFLGAKLTAYALLGALGSLAQPSIVAGDGSGGCALSLVFQGRQYYLTATGETPIQLAPQEPGTIEYTCSMGMYGGRIDVV